MSPEEMRKRAQELLTKGRHWSQAVLTVGQEKMNMVNETVIKAVGAYGGGIAATGRACGALLGGVALLSSVYSRVNLDDEEDERMGRLTYEFVKKFEELTQEHGGVNCHDIARVDWQDEAAKEDFFTNPESRMKVCMQVVGDAAYALGEMLEQESLK